MSKHTRWLAGELERWSAARIITPEQAGLIRALYPEILTSSAWGLLVFFGLGAVILGLGVVLLLAYNWDAIPKAGKLALVFGGVAASHGTGLWLRTKADWRMWLGEGLSMLGTMLFGAGIWLVAQVYHIDEHFPNGFLYWGLGALAMAWAMPSVGQGMIASITLTIWCGFEVLDFDASTNLASLLLLAGVGLLAWRLRSALLTAVGLAGLYLSILFNAGLHGSETGFFAAWAFPTLLIGAGRLIQANAAKARQGTGRVVLFYGLLGALLCGYVLSFHDVAGELDGRDLARGGISAALHVWVWGGLALLVWGWAAVRVQRGERALVPLEEWLFPAALLFILAIQASGFGRAEHLNAGVFNLVVLFVGAMWAVRGCRDAQLRSVVLGSLLVGAVVFARFFDLFDSLAMRGLVFLGFGAALFAEGFYYRKMRRRDALALERNP